MGSTARAWLRPHAPHTSRCLDALEARTQQHGSSLVPTSCVFKVFT